MIHLAKVPNADSRTAKDGLTREELGEATIQHIAQVNDALEFFRDMLQKAGENHDHTKMNNLNEFYEALKSDDIYKTGWYQNHIMEERHHLKTRVPYKVNLIDIIEHLCDCVVAGLTRSGEICDIDLSSVLIYEAYLNTVEMLKGNIVVDSTSE
jgi:DNA-directed RNA polymerase subunit L